MGGVEEAFIDVTEVQALLGVGSTKAYAIIKQCNKELEAQGFLTLRGKCPRKFFEQKVYGLSDINKEK